MAVRDWEAPLDPSDLKDYIADWTELVDDQGDTISSFTATLTSEASTAGLEIDSSAIVTGNKKIRIFFKVNASNQSDVGFTKGVRLGTVIEIVTSGSRTIEKTFRLLVQQQ